MKLKDNAIKKVSFADFRSGIVQSKKVSYLQSMGKRFDEMKTFFILCNEKICDKLHLQRVIQSPVITAKSLKAQNPF